MITTKVTSKLVISYKRIIILFISNSFTKEKKINKHIWTYFIYNYIFLYVFIYSIYSIYVYTRWAILINLPKYLCR